MFKYILGTGICLNRWSIIRFTTILWIKGVFFFSTIILRAQKKKPVSFPPSYTHMYHIHVHYTVLYQYMSLAIDHNKSFQTAKYLDIFSCIIKHIIIHILLLWGISIVLLFSAFLAIHCSRKSKKRAAICWHKHNPKI